MVKNLFRTEDFFFHHRKSENHGIAFLWPVPQTLIMDLSSWVAGELKFNDYPCTRALRIGSVVGDMRTVLAMLIRS